MPPKGSGKRKSAQGTPGDVSVSQTPTLVETLSYLHDPRPFKNPYYTKNVNRRTKNLKAVLTAERERERQEREKRKQEKEEKMQVDGAGPVEEEEEMPTYSSIEAPPSFMPAQHFCDVTGLEGPYTEPLTGLRYHDKNVYDVIKNMQPAAVKEYLSIRGVSAYVK